MSANAKINLGEVKAKFEKFRAGRVGKERLPENLWAEAVALLDQYPFKEVCEQLRLKPAYLKRRAGLASNQTSPKSPKFLALTTTQLRAMSSVDSECQLVIERVDGSRLTVKVPIERIESLCASFLRA